MNQDDSTINRTNLNKNRFVSMNPSVPIDANIIPMEPSLNHEYLFPYIRYTFYHYVPNKPNKKKMKQWIEAIPYFLPENHQNIFFTLIRTYPIEVYWDSRDKMEEYGYLLYSSFHHMIYEYDRV